MREYGLIRLYKRLATPILALVMLLGAGWGARPLAAATVDTLYHNGKIYTLTESMREAKDPRKANTVEVVATRDGKIIFAGSAAAARQQGLFANAARIVDLHGKTMLPGLIDGHGHFPLQGGYDLFQVNLNSFPLGRVNTICLTSTLVLSRHYANNI